MVTGSTPILAASNVADTVKYYQEVLGFPVGWVDEAGTFGGVSWGSVQIMFSHQSGAADHVNGHQHWIDVDDVDAMCVSHMERGARIVSPVDDKPWGRREYTVQDINGYHLRFAGQPSYISVARPSLADEVQIVRRKPTPAELAQVATAAFGFQSPVKDALKRSWNGVVAVDATGQTIGVLRINCDAPGWFSVWDVAVLPKFQGQRIGSAMMEAALDMVRRESPGSFVYLFTLKPGFYERLGFEKQTHHVKRV